MKSISNNNIFSIQFYLFILKFYIFNSIQRRYLKNEEILKYSKQLD